MKTWMIVSNGNEKASNMLLNAIQKYIPYKLLCENSKKDGYNAIELIVDNAISGVSIEVFEANGENQSIVIKGSNEANLLYAVSDFKNVYIPYAKNAERHMSPYYINELFTAPLKPYSYKITPSIKDRGIWLWGYTMYDYRRFIDNMLELKLNTLIVWNDDLPSNLNEVIAYAHENYIKVYLGFAWGWDTVVPSSLTKEYLEGVANSVLNTYKTNYANINHDGVYCQSFTEHTNEFLGGVPVAEAVTDLVNTIGGKLLSEYPNLKILFGLHAGSVIKRLEAIRKVDERISIIWEDVGAFPYHYIPTKIENFEETIEKTDAIKSLREKGGFGVVLKGVICLDWGPFKHYEGAYVMGEVDKEFIKQRANEKREILRIIQAGWLKNGKYALDVIKRYDYNSMVTCLVEDGMLEEIVNLPTALYASIMWNSNRSFDEILYETSMRSDVDFV